MKYLRKIIFRFFLVFFIVFISRKLFSKDKKILLTGTVIPETSIIKKIMSFFVKEPKVHTYEFNGKKIIVTEDFIIEYHNTYFFINLKIDNQSIKSSYDVVSFNNGILTLINTAQKIEHYIDFNKDVVYMTSKILTPTQKSIDCSLVLLNKPESLNVLYKDVLKKGHKDLIKEMTDLKKDEVLGFYNDEKNILYMLQDSFSTGSFLVLQKTENEKKHIFENHISFQNDQPVLFMMHQSHPMGDPALLSTTKTPEIISMSDLKSKITITGEEKQTSNPVLLKVHIVRKTLPVKLKIKEQTSESAEQASESEEPVISTPVVQDGTKEQPKTPENKNETKKKIEKITPKKVVSDVNEKNLKDKKNEKNPKLKRLNSNPQDTSGLDLNKQDKDVISQKIVGRNNNKGAIRDAGKSFDGEKTDRSFNKTYIEIDLDDKGLLDLSKSFDGNIDHGQKENQLDVSKNILLDLPAGSINLDKREYDVISQKKSEGGNNNKGAIRDAGKSFDGNIDHGQKENQLDVSKDSLLDLPAGSINLDKREDKTENSEIMMGRNHAEIYHRIRFRDDSRDAGKSFDGEKINGNLNKTYIKIELDDSGLDLGKSINGEIIDDKLNKTHSEIVLNNELDESIINKREEDVLSQDKSEGDANANNESKNEPKSE